MRNVMSRLSRLNVLPTGQVSFKNDYFFWGCLYFLGQVPWFFTLGLGLFDWSFGLVMGLLWGIHLQALRVKFQNYKGLALKNGRWILITQLEPLEPLEPGAQAQEHEVFLSLNSVILPGLLLLNFQDAWNQHYRLLITPGMVSGKEKFSWISRYAKLTPLFQKKPFRGSYLGVYLGS